MKKTIYLLTVILCISACNTDVAVEVTNDKESEIFEKNISDTSKSNSFKIKQRILDAGFISNINQMVMLYSAVCVTVIPSLEENLSNVIMESLACGTPVVAFNIGGNSDMITHKVNGYLAIPFDLKDLAQGIDWVLNNKDEFNLSQNSVNKVREEFDYSIVAKKYIDLYKTGTHDSKNK